MTRRGDRLHVPPNTYAFEIFEQLKKAPDTVMVPVGNGTLELGVYYGFKELFEAKKINRMPKILAIQAEKCAPLAKAFENQETMSEAELGMKGLWRRSLPLPHLQGRSKY